jgi:hypothetical protein
MNATKTTSIPLANTTPRYWRKKFECDAGMVGGSWSGGNRPIVVGVS